LPRMHSGAGRFGEPKQVFFSKPTAGKPSCAFFDTLRAEDLLAVLEGLEMVAKLLCLCKGCVATDGQTPSEGKKRSDILFTECVPRPPCNIHSAFGATAPAHLTRFSPPPERLEPPRTTTQRRWVSPGERGAAGRRRCCDARR